MNPTNSSNYFLNNTLPHPRAQDTRTEPRAHDAETNMLRYISDGLSLPRLCRSKGCRRMLACKGEPRECLSRYAPLVPEDAREWMKAALAGLDGNLAFEEVFADHRADFEAFVAWREALEHAYGK